MTPCMVALNVAARMCPWKLLLERSILSIRRFSSLLLVVVGELSVILRAHVRHVPRRCIRFSARIRSWYIRCIRIVEGCFTDSTIATGFSTTETFGRFRSGFIVSSHRVLGI